MEPRRSEDDALVDLVDVILHKGAVIQADVVITVADVPLVGLKLRAALAGMTTMTEYGLFEEWDERIRRQSRESEAVDDSHRSRKSLGRGGRDPSPGARDPNPDAIESNDRE